MGTNKLTPEQIALAREMRASGMTLKAIADKFGVSDQTIQNYCKDIPGTIKRKDGICPRCGINPRTGGDYCTQCSSEYQRKNRAGRKGRQFRTDGICPRCGKNPRTTYSTGRLAQYCVDCLREVGREFQRRRYKRINGSE